MRDKIIDATVEEFKQNGLKFTMNDLAKRLGISKKQFTQFLKANRQFW